MVKSVTHRPAEVFRYMHAWQHRQHTAKQPMEGLLESQLVELEAQVTKALQAQRQLQIKQSIISAMCCTLEAVQHQLDPSQRDILECAHESICTKADLELLDQLEAQQPCLSSQSGNKPSSQHQHRFSQVRQGSRLSAAAAAVDPADDWPKDTLSPPHDPLLYYRRLLDSGPLPQVQKLTMQELQQHYRHTVQEGLLHIQVIEESHTQQQHPGLVDRSYAAIKQAVHVFLHRWTSLVVLGRGDLLYQFHLSNCLTGERVEQQDLRPYQTAAQTLGLTPQQKQHIADCMPVFKQLQQAVLDQLQQVQQESVHEAVDDAGLEMQLPMGMMQQPSSRQLSQQQHRQRAHRLYVLLRKQHLIGVCCNAYVLGCMTPLQIAKLGRFTYPFAAFMFLFATEVEKVVQREQSQPHSSAPSAPTAGAMTAAVQ